MDFEKSCGAVIYRKIHGNLEFLIISHRNDGHWGFPKGHIEKNESEEQAAKREVSEETGITATLMPTFKASVEYLIKQNTVKEVVYFLAQVQDQTVYIDVEEIMDYRWSSFKQAKQLLSYKSSKEVLEQAYEYIVEIDKNPMK